VNASTLSRIGQGAKPDVNGLASLLSWAGLKAESFIRGDSKKKSEPLAEILALLRADPRLSKQNVIGIQTGVQGRSEPHRSACTGAEGIGRDFPN
jgi:hypothetical protein